MADRGRGYGGSRGGRGDFNQESEGGGGGRGSYGGGAGRGTFPSRGDYNQDSEGGRGGFNRGGGRGNQDSQAGGFAGRGNFNQGSDSGRGGYSARGAFNQGSEAGENTRGGGGFGRGGGRGNQDSDGQNARGNYGGGRGRGNNQEGEGGRGSYGGGRGNFAARGDFNQGSGGGSFGRGGGGGYNQNFEGGENQRGGYSGRGFNQDSEGGGFRGGRDGGRGGNFNQDSEGGGFRGGRGGFAGRGDFNQGSDAGDNSRGGGRGGGRGGNNQDRNYGDQENQRGPGRGGFTQSRTGADAPAAEGLEGEVPEPQRAPINFVPKVRELAQVYKEDEESAALYSQLTDFDDDVIVENSKCEVVRVQNWDEADFDSKIIENVKVNSKYSRPRKIQGATIPFILDHFDIKAQAETGSGKTAAFLLPILDSCIKAKKSTGEDKFVSELAAPYAVIIGPTRELVLQVFEQALKFANGTGISVAKAYGQYNINRNHEEIRNGCDILIATVGRLKQFVLNEDIFVHKIRYLVLDEADRLLDGSFKEDIKAITNVPRFPTKEKRVTMLFSATFDNSVMEIADQMLKREAVFITNHRNDPNKKIKQDFIVIDNSSKSRLDVLTDLLKEELQKVGASEKMRRTLVFVNTKRSSDMAALYLCQHGVPATSINGDRGQDLREKALNEFRTNVVSVLISTDVTARGIDVKHLDHVINYDLPPDAITYTHRIGRTGRITQGFATTFVEGSEPILHEIAESLKKIGPLPESLEKAMKANPTPQVERPPRDTGGAGASANFTPVGASTNFTPAAGGAPPPREPSSGNNGPALIPEEYPGNDW